MLMSSQAAVGLTDLLDNCAAIQAGQEVLILAVTDGLHGGPNLVDEAVVTGIQNGVLLRQARPSVLWIDLPDRPHAWRVPPIVKGALAGADVFITHAFDLPNEELLELRDLLAEHNVPMVRNMATTAPLLASAWARTPYELVSEIRFRTGSLFEAGLAWQIQCPLGTDLKGAVGAPLAPFKHYGERRTEGSYRPFPEGISMPVRTTAAEGVIVFDRTSSWWARYLGLAPSFPTPVRLEVRANRIVGFAGGAEAQTLERFYSAMAKRFGEAVYELSGLHGGVHPRAEVAPHECPDAAYREFIEHHHTGSVHLHLGRVPRTAEYPYMLHVTAELREVTWRLGDRLICDRGRLSTLDHPEVQAVAARYPDRPGIPAEA
jgi:hypothetical protein